MEGIRDAAAHLWHNDSFLSLNTTAAMSPRVDLALNILSTTMMCIVMLSLGCTMELSKINVTSEAVHTRPHRSVRSFNTESSSSFFPDAHHEAQEFDDSTALSVWSHAFHRLLPR